MRNKKNNNGLNPKLKAYLEIIRVPNLFTVPGDPLAGMFLAYACTAQPPAFALLPFLARAGLLILTALMLYTAGLILNDYADYNEDKISRPARPLPSARIGKKQALCAGLVLLFAALLPAYAVHPRALAGAAAVTLLVLLYNFVLKQIPYIGALNMGLCRGLNLLTGALAVVNQPGHPLLLAAALLYTAYIAAVTIIANEETKQLPHGLKKHLPFICTGALLVGSVVCAYPGFITLGDKGMLYLLFAVCAAFLLIRSIKLAARMRRPALKQLPGLIGAFIRLVIPMQALCCCLGVILTNTDTISVFSITGGLVVPLVLLTCYFIAGKAGRYFYGS